jgi:hypothetical protein
MSRNRHHRAEPYTSYRSLLSPEARQRLESAEARQSPTNAAPEPAPDMEPTPDPEPIYRPELAAVEAPKPKARTCVSKNRMNAVLGVAARQKREERDRRRREL